MKRKHLLSTAVFLLAWLCGIGNIQAQEPYAVLSDNNTVLTFYYDKQMAARGGMSVGPFSYISGKPTTSWYEQRNSITTVVFDASLAECKTLTSTAFWFRDCSKINTIKGIENLKTDNVIDMNCMFSSCSKLTSLDVRGLKTDKVKNMSGMFYGCSKLTSIDVSGFKTDNVTDMHTLFAYCSSLTSLDLTSFKTEKVIDMSSMFDGCKNLTSINLSSFNTSNVTNMDGMFWACHSLMSLDLSSFKTSKVESMRGMFWSCSSLMSLDLSSFYTSKVQRMSEMFNGCPNLATIYADQYKWSTAKVTYSNDMFTDCTNLVGGKGTTYDSGHTNAEYARIDKPGQPGYLTDVNGSEPEGDGIAIDATNFPDEAFRNYLLSQSYGSDGILTEKEISKVSNFSLSNKNIQSLKGIEYFTALRDLRCDGNQLATLDVTKNTALDYLSCTNNMLSSLDVTKNTALTMIVCRNNMLSSLDVTKNVALTDLSCEKNQLTTLDLSNNTALTHIHCRDNKLRTLDVSNNLALQWLECDNNQLTSIIVSNSSELFWLDCKDNNIHGLAMDNLISSLPVVQSGIFTVISYYEDEGNVCTKKQVNAAKQKGWRVKKFDHVDNIYTNVEYDGSDDDLAVGDLFTEQTIEGVTMTFMVTSLDPMECQVGDGTEAAISQSTTGVVTIPAEANGFAVTSIGSNAFKGCKMTETVIPASVTNVASGAFSGCESLANVTAEGLTPFSMADDAFDDATYAVCIINVPDDAMTPYQNANLGQKFMTMQPMSAKTAMGVGYMFTEQINNPLLMLFKVTSANTVQIGSGGHASVHDGTAVEVRIPEKAKGYTVTAIGNRGFYKCAKLKRVWATNKIESIGDEAFFGCTSLTTFDLPNRIKHISETAFRNTNIVISYHPGQEGILPPPSPGTTYKPIPHTKEDGEEEYEDTKTIFIPVWMTDIGARMYSYCKSVIKMEVAAGNQAYDSREDCNAIIRKSDNKLIYGCQNTKIPTSVTGIEAYAFEGHSKLKHITIPKSITSIGQMAFRDIEMETVESAIRDLFSINDNTFSQETYDNATLYVRVGMIDVYRQTHGWKNFVHIEEKDFDDAIIVTAVDLEREYGDENPEFIYTVEGGCANGTATVTCEATALSPVGTYAIVVAKGDLKNSDVTLVNGTLTITKAPLVIGAWDATITQGDDLPEFTCFYHGFKNDENEDVLTSLPSVTTDATSQSEPGVYDLVPSGAEARNYSIRYVNGTLSIMAPVPIPDDLPPVDGDGGTDYGSEDSGITDETDLNGNAIGNIFYCISPDAGGYSSTEGCLVINKSTPVNSLPDQGDDAISPDFHGLVFRVNAGTGKIKITAETTGMLQLSIVINGNVVFGMTINGKTEVECPYSVSESSFVYIFATGVSTRAATADDAEGEVKIYSIEWMANEENGIESMENGQWTIENADIFNLSGQRLVKPQRGVNIIGGKKIIVK